MKILVFGDIVGKIGRKAVRKALPKLKDEFGPDLTIANVENVAHGKGITPDTLREIMDMGVDFMTSGNHVWDKRESFDCFADPAISPKLIRPANYPAGVPGAGAKLLTVGTKNVLVVNLLGRVMMKTGVDDPFRTFDRILTEWPSPKPQVVLVDFHAEATSEKAAFGWHVQGRATAVWGSHTHVMTADARILPEIGPAFITDIGMCGIRDGIIGFSRETALPHYLTSLPMRTEIPDGGEAIVNAIVIETDGQGRSLGIETVIRTVTV
ncbi:YmdB family metallophosphoesterase [Candidatus Uhrbacteria bacterium]|nr:YmdB family metallophosphoesterase [Candidatus Uhrbacteria bacterium]